MILKIHTYSAIDGNGGLYQISNKNNPYAETGMKMAGDKVTG